MSIACMLEKDCDGNPISSFPPFYAFQMIFTALAPRIIQSISRKFHNKFRALKQLWVKTTMQPDLDSLKILILREVKKAGRENFRKHQNPKSGNKSKI